MMTPDTPPKGTLHYYAAIGDLDGILSFVERYGVAVLNDNTQRMGKSPLHQAIASYQRDAAELLINLGADVNLPDAQGNTPLGYATYIGRRDFATLLLVRGARLDCRNNAGITVLEWARKNDAEMAELLNRWVKPSPDAAAQRLQQLKQKRPPKLNLKPKGK